MDNCPFKCSDESCGCHGCVVNNTFDTVLSSKIKDLGQNQIEQVRQNIPLWSLFIAQIIRWMNKMCSFFEVRPFCFEDLADPSCIKCHSNSFYTSFW